MGAKKTPTSTPKAKATPKAQEDEQEMQEGTDEELEEVEEEEVEEKEMEEPAKVEKPTTPKEKKTPTTKRAAPKEVKPKKELPKTTPTAKGTALHTSGPLLLEDVANSPARLAAQPCEPVGDSWKKDTVKSHIPASGCEQNWAALIEKTVRDVTRAEWNDRLQKIERDVSSLVVARCDQKWVVETMRSMRTSLVPEKTTVQHLDQLAKRIEAKYRANHDLLQQVKEHLTVNATQRELQQSNLMQCTAQMTAQQGEMKAILQYWSATNEKSGRRGATSREESSRDQFPHSRSPAGDDGRLEPPNKVSRREQDVAAQNERSARPFRSSCTLCLGNHYEGNCPRYPTGNSRAKRLIELNLCTKCEGPVDHLVCPKAEDECGHCAEDYVERGFLEGSYHLEYTCPKRYPTGAGRRPPSDPSRRTTRPSRRTHGKSGQSRFNR